MRRALALSALLAMPLAPGRARADDPPLIRREAFANAHVLMMARVESRDGSAKMADVELWASGDKLRAKILPSGGGAPGEIWLDGLTSEAMLLREGKPAEPRRRSLEQGLQVSLQAAPELGNSKNDRIAGHPCKVLSEDLPSGATLTRCIWRGIPLSMELSGRGFSFNAAATLVEESRVTVADLQPPPGAPASAKNLAASR